MCAESYQKDSWMGMKGLVFNVYKLKFSALVWIEDRDIIAFRHFNSRRSRQKGRERHPSRHPTAGLRSYQNWSWLLFFSKFADGSDTPIGGSWSPLQTPNRRPSLFSKLILAPAISFVPYDRSLHSLFVQTAGHEDSDIISVRRDLCGKTASKKSSAQSRICLLIPKPTEKGLHSEDIEKKQTGAILSDQPLQSERLRSPAVHLHYHLGVVVHQANQFAELQFESCGLQNSRQKSMVPLVDPNWSARLQCRLLSPIGSRIPRASCLGSIFLLQRSSALVRSDH